MCMTVGGRDLSRAWAREGGLVGEKRRAGDGIWRS